MPLRHRKLEMLDVIRGQERLRKVGRSTSNNGSLLWQVMVWTIMNCLRLKVAQSPYLADYVLYEGPWSWFMHSLLPPPGRATP